ncbi:MAG: HlyD family secretion protein [Nitrospira sp.]|nr:HlyD family secretion protein [Nitrospira sp.]
MAFRSLGRQWTVWKAAWEAESGQPPNRAVPEGPAAEFLPEALDLQHRPTSPIGPALLVTMLIISVALACWTLLVRIDSVTAAHGKVVRSGDSKPMHSSESGVVRTVYVQDGQTVKQGDVLIELEGTRTLEERDRLSKEYRAIQVEAARLRALIEHQTTLKAPPDGDADEIRFQQQLLRDQLTQHQAKIAAAQQLVNERRTTMGQTKETLLRGKAALAVETARAEQSKKLVEHGVGAKADFLQAESRRLEKFEEVSRLQKQLEQDRAALVEAEQEAHALVWNFRKTKQAELSALEAKAASLAQEATKAERNIGLQQVRSPMDGVVHQLAVQAVGTVVTPAQQLLMVVPPDQSVEVEAHVELSDVGMVHTGQPVEVKINALQSASHSTIRGYVLKGPDDAPSVKNVEPVSPVRIRLDRATIREESTEVTLAPGTVVMVEIKTGPRRMIDYLLEPLRQSGNERVREWNDFVHAVRGFLDRRQLS